MTTFLLQRIAVASVVVMVEAVADTAPAAAPASVAVVLVMAAAAAVWICRMSFMCLGGLDAFWIWEGGQGPRSKSTSGKGGFLSGTNLERSLSVGLEL